jgi:hypothetical protein
MVARSLLALAFISITASAQVTVTSVTPSSGPTSGGTVVTIRGTGFEYRIGSPTLPPGVYFGGTEAVEVDLVDETTIRAVAPPHPGATVNVGVDSFGGGGVLQNAFTYTVDVDDDHFETILLPILTPPVKGAFDSEFHTTLLASSARTSYRTVHLYGLRAECLPPPRQCNAPDPLTPLRLPYAEAVPLRVVMSGTPGRFIYVPEGELHRLSLNLRVQDVTRAALNFGTEMPIVRERDFQTNRIVLLGVPADPRFRNTLRIYSTRATSMRVTVGEHPPFDIFLPAGRDMFEPAYASFVDFPPTSGPVDVTIEPTPNMLPVVPPPFWAFITVTNNETQLITTITPRP